jgi:hypothetical protein
VRVDGQEPGTKLAASWLIVPMRMSPAVGSARNSMFFTPWRSSSNTAIPQVPAARFLGTKILRTEPDRFDRSEVGLGLDTGTSVSPGSGAQFAILPLRLVDEDVTTFPICQVVEVVLERRGATLASRARFWLGRWAGCVYYPAGTDGCISVSAPSSRPMHVLDRASA